MSRCYLCVTLNTKTASSGLSLHNECDYIARSVFNQGFYFKPRSIQGGTRLPRVGTKTDTTECLPGDALGSVERPQGAGQAYPAGNDLSSLAAARSSSLANLFGSRSHSKNDFSTVGSHGQMPWF